MKKNDMIMISKEDIQDKYNACIEIINALKRTRDKIINNLDIVKITQLSIQIARYKGKLSIYKEIYK
jgi:hypothetical protein